ncbi:MAG: hypothetical protein N2738_00205 [Thermodesulfovibrionales bacterium]|nr:hypothetical protein [Thermodesulfovibrionales bacterium]
MKDFSWFTNLLMISGTYLPNIKNEVRVMLAEHDLKCGCEQPKKFRAYRVSGRLIKESAFKSAGIGGLTGVPANLPLLGTIGTVLLGSAVDFYYLMRIQVELCYGISVAYEVEMDEDELKAVTLALIGFSGSAEAFKAITSGVMRRMIDELAESYLKNGIAKASSDVAVRLIPRLMQSNFKYIPLLGIPLSASINVASTMTVGNHARRYFNILSDSGISVDDEISQKAEGLNKRGS